MDRKRQRTAKDTGSSAFVVRLHAEMDAHEDRAKEYERRAKESEAVRRPELLKKASLFVERLFEVFEKNLLRDCMIKRASHGHAFTYINITDKSYEKRITFHALGANSILGMPRSTAKFFTKSSNFNDGDLYATCLSEVFAGYFGEGISAKIEDKCQPGSPSYNVIVNWK